MDHIIGQPRAIDTLQAALQSGRVHHAFVFHGPTGVGKFTTAVSFARVLLCHDPQPDLAGRVTACDACASCRLLHDRVEQASTSESDDGDDVTIGGAHPDFHVVTKELARFSDDKTTRERKLMNIPVAVLEEHLVGPVYRAAQLKHHKVFIVDEAELIDPFFGQNKLLKTLEEPPAGTYIILVTSNEDRLLPTIRSRCQRVSFFSLSDDVIGAWYARQDLHWREDELQWMTDFAAGSLGRAATAVQHDLVQWARTVIPGIEQLARGNAVSELGEQIGTMIDDFASGWVKSHANASKEAANKRAADMMWTLITQYARRQITTLAPRCDGSDVLADEAQLMPWLGVIDAVAQVEREVATNVNLKLACDHLVSLLSRALAPAHAR